MAWNKEQAGTSKYPAIRPLELTPLTESEIVANVALGIVGKGHAIGSPGDLPISASTAKQLGR